ncbi:hypothetical protein [Botrimarina mediterranea]|uniref:hypothetical protein n=1 Tax=Botrimarina mediterranea TaxID=2528022 RepID=UPI00118999EE|nr:hypothetical protein K2D_17000 [Planctomycetes bacterium K2D]
MTTPQPLTLRNDAGETAPAFAISEVSDAAPVLYEISTGSDIAADSVLVIRKPTGTGRVVAVGPAAIEDDRFGKGFTGDCFVRFTGSDPSPGDILYATSGSWAVSASGTGTGVTVAGDIRDMGSYKIVRVEIGATAQQGDFGIATLNEALLTSDTEVDIVGYTPVLGTSTPGSEPATVGNVNDLEGDSGATVIVVSTGSGWQVAAVLALESQDAEHGFCRPYADFTDSDTDIRPAGYQSVEGVDEPDDSTTSVANDGFSATTSDTLAVAYRSGEWQVRYVIPAAVVRYGVVSSATAASWDNATSTMTNGTVAAWMFADDGTINRAGSTESFPLRWTTAPEEGSVIAELNGELVVMTCGELEDWGSV